MIRLHPLGLLSYNTIIHFSLIGGCNAGRCHDRWFNTGKNFFGNSGLSSRRHHRDNVRDMFGPFNKNSVPLWFRLQIIFLIRWHYIVLYNGRCWWNWHVWILRFSPDVKKCEKMRKWKNAKKCEKNVWKSSWEGGTLISFSSGLIFLGSSFAAVTLLPAQLLQVENRRGAVQIDRKWTVQIADLWNLAIAKQWLPGAKHKRTKPQTSLKIHFFHIFHIFEMHFFTVQKYFIFETHFFPHLFTFLIQTTTTLL